MSLKYNTILFDFDGTLLDTLEDLMDAVNHTLTEFGYEPHSYEEIRTFVGNGIRKLMIRSTPGGENNPKFEEMLEEFKSFYNSHNRIKTKPYDGILDLLYELKDLGVLMAVVTNKAQTPVDSLMAEEFEGIIDIAIGDDGVRGLKPDSEPVTEALRLLGVSAEDYDKVIYIGDSEVDAQTAKNAGLDCILVTWGFRDKDTLEAQESKFIIDSPGQILDIIKG